MEGATLGWSFDVNILSGLHERHVFIYSLFIDALNISDYTAGIPNLF
jgi:hypothetical protein